MEGPDSSAVAEHTITFSTPADLDDTRRTEEAIRGHNNEYGSG